MSVRVMLDTNAVAALVKGRSPMLEDYVRGQPLCISVVTEAEVHYGLARRPVGGALRRVIEGLLATVEILPWDSACAVAHGSLRARLETVGKTLAPMDLMIAAHALATRCPLITADRTFTQVWGLSVIEWSAEGVTMLTESAPNRVRTKPAATRLTPRDVHESVAHARAPVRRTRRKAK